MKLQKKFKKYKNLEKFSDSLSPQLQEIIIGSGLGDLNIQKQYIKGNTRLRFEQGLLNKEYLLHLYDLFKDYCSSEPKVRARRPNKITNKIYSTI
jgi:hypothetical protein